MAAAIGNKYALGNNGGRPPVFKTAKELEEKIIEYFDYCTDNKVTITICGLALFVGFNSRTSFYDYGDKQEFMYIIKKARTVVEMCYEERLSGNSPTGAIFALKNMEWKDSQTFDHLNNGNSFNTISDAELVARINKLIEAGKQK